MKHLQGAVKWKDRLAAALLIAYLGPMKVILIVLVIKFEINLILITVFFLAIIHSDFFNFRPVVLKP